MANRKKESSNKNFINKNKYDDIKRMDHREMNEYINGVRKVEYEKGYRIGRVDGYESGRKDAENRINTLAGIDFEGLKNRIRNIKGIGTVKSEEILKLIREEFDRKEPEDATKIEEKELE